MCTEDDRSRHSWGLENLLVSKTWLFGQDSQDRFTAAAGASSSGDQHDTTQGRQKSAHSPLFLELQTAFSRAGVEPEVFPEAVRVIGIVRERLPGAPSASNKLAVEKRDDQLSGEARVSFAPSAVVKLRRMGPSGAAEKVKAESCYVSSPVPPPPPLLFPPRLLDFVGGRLWHCRGLHGRGVHEARRCSGRGELRGSAEATGLRDVT